MQLSDFKKMGSLYLPKAFRSEAGYVLMHRRKAFRFQVSAVVFDGTNDYMERGAALTGAADGKKGILSFWFKMNGGDAAAQRFLSDNLGYTIAWRQADNTLRIACADGAGNPDNLLRSTGTYTADATWHHVLTSWDGAITTNFLYVDDSDDRAGGSSSVNDTYDYTVADHSIGADVGGGNKLNADIAEFYLNLSEYLDISQESNRRLFIDPSGRPVDLGLTGTEPTGNQPIAYFSVRPGDAATVFATNKGSGGNFSITGALAISATSPSD